MNDAISTREFPVKFFIEFFLNDGFQKLKDEFILSCWDKKDKNPKNVDIRITDSDIVMEYWISRNPDPGDASLIDFKLSNKVEDLLDHEVKRSKVLLLDAVTIHHSSTGDFLHTQLIIIKDSIAANKKLKEFFMSKPYLEDLFGYIQRMIINYEQHKSQEHEKKNKGYKNKDLGSSVQVSTENDPIHEILGYLKGKNEFDHKIMSDTAFTKLIESIEKIYKKEEVKIEKNSLDIKEQNGILKYTFYVLHLSLFGRKKNDNYYKFIHGSILQFNECEYDVFKSKISDPPGSFPNYIPLIIKEQKLKQRTNK